MAKKNWIKGAVNPKHKGFCTPESTKSSSSNERFIIDLSADAGNNILKELVDDETERRKYFPNRKAIEDRIKAEAKAKVEAAAKASSGLSSYYYDRM